MEYKRTYKKDEVQELYQWFDTHQFENEIELGFGVSVKNVKETIKNSRFIVLEKYDNPTYSGQIQLLFHLRDELIKQGKVKE